MENLNRIQHRGIIINNCLINFSFSTLVADNLAAHWIGGFQCNFNSGYFCRRCYITYPDRNLPMTKKINTRTILNHDDIVEQIIANPDKSPMMGVIGESPIRDLVGFHSISSLPADLMHDFLEGICPIVVLALLKEVSSMRLLTYGEILLRFIQENYKRMDSITFLDRFF